MQHKFGYKSKQIKPEPNLIKVTLLEGSNTANSSISLMEKDKYNF